MEERYNLEKYLKGRRAGAGDTGIPGEEGFAAVCEIVERCFEAEWEKSDDRSRNMRLEREKRAIIGYEKEVRYYKERIREILRERRLTESWFPPWYPNLAEGVFAELYGLSGLAPWAYDMCEKYRDSSSAKLIGERMYCLIDGRSQLQPQRIPRRRREKLKRTLLLATPEERVEYGFHEVYLLNGIRITIYSGSRTKEDQDIMVFRKYVLKELTFEKMVQLGTIPEGSPKLFRAMVEAGFNVIFAGQVRSGKTTFLQTWQKYEDPALEGLAISTDPETPWHEIMPEAPIMQLVADGKQLESVVKSLLRGDNDYVLLEEMRDGTAFRLALEITSTGTMRSKVTIHASDAAGVPYKMASRIHEQYGGDLDEIIAQVFKNFDYIFEFCQDPEDKRKKLLQGISELSYDIRRDEVRITRICQFNFPQNRWEWNAVISPDKRERAVLFRIALEKMMEQLNDLAETFPIKGEKVLIPAYYGRSRE